MTHQEQICLFNELPGLMSVLNREKRVRANILYSSQMKRVKSLMNIEDFHHKPEVKEAISNLSTNPTPHNIQQGSRFLIACLIIDGGARPSVIQNVALKEVDMAEQVNLKEDGSSYWVLPVHEHKTDLQGIFYLACQDEAFKAVLELRHAINNSKYLFCLPNGNQMSSSRVNYELNMTWTKCGMRQTYGAFNATMNRKRLATKMATISPELSSKMAKQLRHALNTHQKYYNMVHGPSEAAEVIHEAKKMIEVIAPEPAPEHTPEHAPEQHEANNTLQVQAEVHTPIHAPEHAPEHEASNKIQAEVCAPEHAPVHEASNTFEVQAEVHAEQGHSPNIIQEKNSPPPSPIPGQLVDPRTAQWILKTDPDLSPPLYAEAIPGVTSGSLASSSYMGRRKWTAEENEEFFNDFRALVLLAQEKNSKPYINTVRSTIKIINKEKWFALNDSAVRDKIWNMARCLRKHGVHSLST